MPWKMLAASSEVFQFQIFCAQLFAMQGRARLQHRWSNKNLPVGEDLSLKKLRLSSPNTSLSYGPKSLLQAVNCPTDQGEVLL